MMKKTKLSEPEMRIIVTDPDLSVFHNREWIVTEKPLCGRFFGPSNEDLIWLGPESGPDWPRPQTRLFLSSDQYEVVQEFVEC